MTPLMDREFFIPHVYLIYSAGDKGITVIARVSGLFLKKVAGITGITVIARVSAIFWAVFEVFIPHPRIKGIKGIKEIKECDMDMKYWDNYTLWRYVEQVESIQDGVTLPDTWWSFMRWMCHMPISRLTKNMPYYSRKFGYRRNGDVYEVDRRCVGAICMVVILVGGGMPISTVARSTGLSEVRIRSILKNYKYYVGWHNAYTMDGRRIWPAIREVELLHKDLFGDAE